YSAASTPAVCSNARVPRRRFSSDIAARVPASPARLPVRIRIEQPMQVDDEVAHMSVVDSLLRLRLPGGIGAGVVRIDAHDVEPVEILEFGASKVAELAAEDEVEQLSARELIGHRAILAPSLRDPSALRERV